MNDPEAGTSAIARKVLNLSDVEMKTVDDSKDDSKNSSKQETREWDTSCFLLEDTNSKSAPVYLTRYLNLLPDSNMMPSHDLLFHIVYLMALECGFVSVKDFDRLSSKLLRPSPDTMYHSKNMSILSETLPEFSIEPNESFWIDCCLNVSDSPNGLYGENSKILSRLSGIASGDYMFITMWDKRACLTDNDLLANPDASTSSSAAAEHKKVRVSESTESKLSSKSSTSSASILTQSYSTILSIQRYIFSPRRSYKAPQHRFQKLDELSMKLRDEVFLRLRTLQISEGGFMTFPALHGLPYELYENIFQHLSRPDMLALACASKNLNELVKDSKHYKNLPIKVRFSGFRQFHSEINL